MIQERRTWRALSQFRGAGTDRFRYQYEADCAEPDVDVPMTRKADVLRAGRNCQHQSSAAGHDHGDLEHHLTWKQLTLTQLQCARSGPSVGLGPCSGILQSTETNGPVCLGCRESRGDPAGCAAPNRRAEIQADRSLRLTDRGYGRGACE